MPIALSPAFAMSQTPLIGNIILSFIACQDMRCVSQSDLVLDPLCVELVVPQLMGPSKVTNPKCCAIVIFHYMSR